MAHRVVLQGGKDVYIHTASATRGAGRTRDRGDRPGGMRRRGWLIRIGPRHADVVPGIGRGHQHQDGQALADAFHAKNPDITIKVDASGRERPDLDNLVKTRLATGEMPDLFWYNSGSLLRPSTPTQTMLDIVGDEPWVKNLDPVRASCRPDRRVFGAPAGPPTAAASSTTSRCTRSSASRSRRPGTSSWRTHEAIKAPGTIAVEQTYGDAWTSQIVTLGDFYNVYATDPDWAEKYTENEVNFADDPVAEQSFTKLQELHDGGFFNEDFASATLDDGLHAVATGKPRHYPMLIRAGHDRRELAPTTSTTSDSSPCPATTRTRTAPRSWMPPRVVRPRRHRAPRGVKKFMAFVASPAGCDAITDGARRHRPLPRRGLHAPGRRSADRRGHAALLRGREDGTRPRVPLARQGTEPRDRITGRGRHRASATARIGAKLYDQDTAKQAQQLGLPGW